MNDFFSFRPSQPFAAPFRILPLLPVLIAILTFESSFGQSDGIFKCPENNYTFTGKPEQTLCEQYPNFACEIEIGAGTTFPKSSMIGASSLSGNICVVGDFEVDVPFSFLDATVKINPGVTIVIKPSPNGYDPGSSLGIDNSKLFACNGLWKGITLGHLSSIGTSNNTKIEDAETAIAATGLCALFIQQTTFNRDRVGIELNTPFPNIFVPGPLVWTFSLNRFSCDAPLNGTTNEITEAGVKLKNSSLFTFQSGINRFDDLKYGIHAVGGASQIGCSNLYMRRIKKDGIYMEEGAINLTSSWIYNLEGNGINIETAKMVIVKNTQFTASTVLSSEYRTGVFINKFALNADVQLMDIKFSADMEGTTNKVRGIQLNGYNVGAGTKIQIKGNSVTGSSTFSFRAKDSQGIYLNGTFPSSSSVEIWGNRFKVSNTTQNVANGRPSGILAESSDKNNLSIKWNTFTSYAVHILPPGQVGPPQWNYGIHLRHNTFGTNNEVSVNGFDYEVQPLQIGLYVEYFQKGLYCSNYFSGYGWATGALFQATCTGTDFRGNIFEFAGDVAFDISEGTEINVQSRKGNQWHNLFGIEPNFHARCLGDPSANKFIVHTEQSTCANEPSPCFNPFHPRKVTPDDLDQFFDMDPDATPLEACDAEFTGNGTDELDRRIAQGTYATSTDDPAQGWLLQRYLYQKFKSYPALTSENPSFPTFVTNKVNTSVGKFYDVHTAMENALKAGANVDAPSAQALSDISTLVEDIADVDKAIEQQGLTEALKTQKQSLILQIHGRLWDYNSLRAIHESQVSSNLRSVFELNQAITTTHDYESYEKTVNQIQLLSLMQQGGELTEQQVATLQSIAQQNPKQGGPAVHAAMGMLKECAKPEIPEQYLVSPPTTAYSNFTQLSEDRIGAGMSRETSEINLFPNPANTSFVIRNVSGTAGTLTLFDISGREWHKQWFSGPESNIQLKEGIPNGVYFLRFDMEDNSCIFKKMIIQHN